MLNGSQCTILCFCNLFMKRHENYLSLKAIFINIACLSMEPKGNSTKSSSSVISEALPRLFFNLHVVFILNYFHHFSLLFQFLSIYHVLQTNKLPSYYNSICYTNLTSISFYNLVICDGKLHNT